MNILKTTCYIPLLCALAVLAPGKAIGANILYNFNFELTNTSGADLFGDAAFSADPTAAVIGTGTGPLGEAYSAPISSIALSIFNLGTAPFSDASVNFSSANLQGTATAWFTPSNLAVGTTDPVFTLSTADSTGFLTAVLSGTATRIYQSSTLGSTAGAPLVSGPGVVGTSPDGSPVPEPSSLWLILAAAFTAAGFVSLRRRTRSI